MNWYKARMRRTGIDPCEEQKPTPYHSWLIRRRGYCELCSGLEQARHVIKSDGHDRVVCDFHWKLKRGGE